jgi:Uma2 family endonuclease
MTATAAQTHRWSREEYERMVSACVFHPEERLELIDGEVFEMTPQSSRHATAVRLVEDALRSIFAQGHDVRTQLPLALDPGSEPEPDIAVVPGRPRDYLDAHPDTAILIVEVADSSLGYDRELKAGLYARHGIPEYWIVNLADSGLEVYRNPEGGRYSSCAVFRDSESLSPLACSGASVSVSELLP